MKRLIVVLLCVFTAGLTLVGCQKKQVKELIITAIPNQHYIVGDSEETFISSLSKGFIAIRYKNETTSNPICMNDDIIEVTGFSSTVPGNRVITVKHKNNPSIYVEYDIYISDIKIENFEISKTPTKNTYFADVEVSDIILDGGKIIEINNKGMPSEEIDMTSELLVVTAIVEKNTNSALVVVRLAGTSFSEKFQIALEEVYPVSFELSKLPANLSFSETPSVEDINLNGLEIVITKNSGKTYEVYNVSEFTVVSVNSADCTITVRINEMTENNILVIDYSLS